MEYERQQVPQGHELSQLFVARSFRICNYVQGLVDRGEKAHEARLRTTYSTFSKLLKDLEGRLGIKDQCASGTK